ncbi:MAG: peptidoglycan glycosyltransferase MrdB [Wenzhouxiangellaceae bacterium]
MNLFGLLDEFRQRPFRLDPVLTSMLLALMVAGLAVLYSASDGDAGLVWRQIVRLTVGLGAMYVASLVPVGSWRRWAPWIYAIGLALLVLVLFVGEGRGSRRWLDLGVVRFQPSEIMKIGVPLMLATWLHRKALPPGWIDVLACIALMALPVALIAIEPDLGTAVLVGSGGAIVLFLSGLRWRWILLGAVSVLSALPLLWGAMHDYQRNRVLTFLDPERDPLGQGWNIIQSKIAVGTGGLTGRGWLDSTQSRLEFLPEPHTDFILSVFAEEFGFVGVLVLIALYAAILVRALQLASQARDPFGRMLGGALAFVFFVYLFVNAGMITGMMPVVGVPLPLVSYGGTSATTILAGFGIIMGINSRRKMLRDR